MRKPVFFSGGTALASLAQALARTADSPVYIITTFDSGGSTQELRKVIDMPAVGDLRNRLLAAADPIQCPSPVRAFLKTRLGAEQSPMQALEELKERIASLPDHEEWGEIKADLEAFRARMPGQFDARRASLGNLALTGNWFENGRSLRRAVGRYQDLLHVNADIVPVCEQNLHLGVRLANGQTLVGQHLSHYQLPAPIQSIFLTDSSPWRSCATCGEARPGAAPEALEAIREADAIYFPMGSFFSSLLVTLLPAGIGRAVAESRSRKIFIPNTGPDIESTHLNLEMQVAELVSALKRDAPQAEARDLVNGILLDSIAGEYEIADFGGFADSMSSLGIDVLDRRIVKAEREHDAEALLAALAGL